MQVLHFLLPSGLVAKIQNSSMPELRFKELTVPSLDDFMGGNRDELHLCPVRALKRYLARTEQFCSGISGGVIHLFMKEEETDVPKHHFVLDLVCHPPHLCIFF